MSNASRLSLDFVIIAILIVGIQQFRAPATARRGNLSAALALVCALAAVLWSNPVLDPAPVLLALALGGAVGTLVAVRVNMLQIPAMVAFQHGAGGVAAFVTSFVELTREPTEPLTVVQLSGILGIVIGAATFSGSMVASAKLANAMRQTPIVLFRHNAVLGVLAAALAALGLFALVAAGPLLLAASLALVLLAIVLGAAFAIRVGGADMPVLISFLNATAGLAASFCGILVENRLLVACGATVAASGSILTHVMCQAMNRSLFRVLVAADITRAAAAPRPATTPPPVAMPQTPEPDGLPPLERAVEAIGQAQSVIIVPGYGMALGHAQSEVAEIAERLQRSGKTVRFAIHPIAGRMPGHMHVLLAEADVDSDLLYDLREINADFKTTDLVLIVGACDVVNPAAIDVVGTPISGMPILAAHEARQVVVCNLDLRPGYSGVENPLYTAPQTILLLGDAKATVNRLLQALRQSSRSSP